MKLSVAPVAVVLFVALTIVPCYSDIPGDLIKNGLPGFSGPLPSPQYSGYIKLGPKSRKSLHYWFVLSENDPKNDPVVLWLNGGPGCSSLYGYFLEQGPLHFDKTRAFNHTSKLPYLIKNPYAWTKIANVIFLESPVGVGLSYSTSPQADYVTNDRKTAVDNYKFLINFFAKYDEFRKNDFYITGESYAGIYIPMLVNIVRTMNSRVSSHQKINVKGIMVGNGCVGNVVGSCGFDYVSSIKIHADFYHGHALFPDALYNAMSEACDFAHSHATSTSEACIELVYNMSKTIGKLSVYNIYERCEKSSSVEIATNTIKALISSHPRYSQEQYCGPQSCFDETDLDTYLNNPLVRTAIHVKPVSLTGKWKVISPNIQYIKSVQSLLSLYPTLIREYRTLIYNGDVDGCVPFIGDERWTSSLGFNIKEPWRPWLVDNQVAGYVTKYDVNDFTFLTVKGAGHMVPQYKPKQAYAMFERFLKQQPF